MSINHMRLAGARLGALPIEKIRPELLGALRDLDDRVKSDYVYKDELIDEHTIPGTKISVGLMASPNLIEPGISHTGTKPVFGNNAQVENILNKDPRSIYELSWDLDSSEYPGFVDPKSLSRRDRLAALHIVKSKFPNLINRIPENSMLYNDPVNDDYFRGKPNTFKRANLYMDYGFGPRQFHGKQYAMKGSEGLEPISPFLSDYRQIDRMVSHLQAARVDDGLAEAIMREREARKTRQVPGGGINIAQLIEEQNLARGIW